MYNELSVRLLSAEDAEAAQTLGYEAFGFPSSLPDEPTRVDRPGRTTFGAFDGDRLVAKMADRQYDSWFGGAEVPTCGIASVTVAMEDRGRGALRPLFDATLRSAVGRGAVLSTLFATAPGIYHRFGYATVADYVTVALPTDRLAAVREGSGGVTVRRAGLADLPAVRAVYDSWAAAQNGPLTRRGPSFPGTDDDFLEAFSGVTVAVDDHDAVIGYASWNRGREYGSDGVLEVSDLLAVRPDALPALLRALGSFASVTPVTKIDISGHDAIRFFLPAAGGWPIEHGDPYMLSVLDVAGALTARRYPTALNQEVDFAVEGHLLTEQNRSYRVTVADGRATCEQRNEDADVRLGPRGLALLYAGVANSANVRFLGELRGGTAETDAALDLMLAARPFHIRDYF